MADASSVIVTALTADDAAPLSILMRFDGGSSSPDPVRNDPQRCAGPLRTTAHN
jgi:hypothetical protein